MTKIIWTYWHQGWEHAPPLVKQCHQSWVRFNPDYEVRALDENTLAEHVELPRSIDFARPDLTVQKVAAFARLGLLCRHGGVWTDATVYCTRPLSDWLEQYFQCRFFAFRSPGLDRLMSNWFLAAEPDSIILQRLYQSFTDFFAENYFTNQDTPLGEQYLQRYTPRWSASVRSTLKWHSRFARKVLRVYPYFIFHYTFNKLILTDPHCAQSWNTAKPLEATPAHALQYVADLPDKMQRGPAEVTARSAPMYKLNWRVDDSHPYWTTVLRDLEALA